MARLDDLIDVCVNITNTQLRGDRDAVLDRAAAAGVAGMLFTATSLTSARDNIALSDGRGRLATAGVHPHDAKDVAGDWREALRALAADPNVRAIGECGLDFNRNFSPRADQIAVFAEQIAIAKDLGLPLFVHDRESEGMVLDCLTAGGTLPPTVIHCFTGTPAELAGYLEHGFYVGITGWVCDRRRGDVLRRIASDIPLDRLLVETDAPFLRPHNAPVDFHGTPPRRNEPALLHHVIEGLAEVRPEPAEEIAAATARNARTLFGFA